MTVRNGYEDIDVIRDADSVVAVISKRTFNGALSVAFMKEFDRDGQVDRTAFVQLRHLEAIARLIPIVKERMDAINDRQRAETRAREAAATSNERQPAQGKARRSAP